MDSSCDYRRIASFATSRKGKGDDAYTCLKLTVGTEQLEVPVVTEHYQRHHEKAHSN
jgi:hypothetical protein